jgi:hypothetical protein
MLVAFESLTNATSPMRPAGSITCSSPRNPLSAAVIALVLIPATDAVATAATTFPSMCLPVNSTADTGTSRSVTVGVRRTIHSPSTEKPSSVDPNGENPTRALAIRSLCSITIGSSRFTTAQSPACWLAKMRALAAA